MFRSVLLLSCGLTTGAHAQFPAYQAEGFAPGAPGYYLVNTVDFGGNNAQVNCAILDGSAHVAYRRTGPNLSTFSAWPDGHLSFAGGGKHYLMDQTLAVVDTVTCANGVITDTHDMRILANGHTLLLGVETVTMDLSGYALFPPGNAAGGTNAQVKSGVVQELDASGALVWGWHAMDHFDFDEVDPARLNDPNTVDWTHCNAVEQDTDGNILLSIRHFNAVVKIDRGTGAVIWRLGGVHNDFDLQGDPGFLGQHDIRRLANGHITLFDNGRADTHPARGVEYALDEVAMTATLVWSGSFSEGAFSRAMGSMQRLSDGSTLIGWGALLPEAAMFSVHDASGTPVRWVRFLDGHVTYRALYFDELPFPLARPTIQCVPQGDLFELTASEGWPGYTWSTGATGPSNQVAAEDTVWVEVPASTDGGWLRSVPFTPGASCVNTAVEEVPVPIVSLYPNPVDDQLTMAFSDGGPHGITVLDVSGRVLRQLTAAGTLLQVGLDGLPAGAYLMRADGRVLPFVKASE